MDSTINNDIERMSFDEEKNIASDNDCLLDHKQCQNKNAESRLRVRTLCIFSVLNGFAVLFHALLVFNPNWPWHELCNDRVSESPQLRTEPFTRDAIQLEIRTFDDVFHKHYSPYRGEPRPELDDAWNTLIHGYNTRVPSSVWVPGPTTNHTLVKLTDGSGDHHAQPAYLHELHCLKTMREYMFPQHYPKTFARFKPEPGESLGVHLDHCFDILRQSSMCHGDMTLIPFEWWDSTTIPQNVIHAPHLCANWDVLTDWSVKHSFLPWGDIIRNPDTGVVPWPVEQEEHNVRPSEF